MRTRLIWSSRRLVWWSVVVVVTAAPLVAEATRAPAPPQTTDVVVDRQHPGGEPEIAVNPRDVRNLVVSENESGVAYSRDGGATWKAVPLPNMGDNVLAVLPDGTFLFSALDGQVYASRDGGATWVKRGNWVGAAAAALYSVRPGLPYPADVAVGDVVRQVVCDAPAVAGLGPVGLGRDQPGVQVLGCDRPWLVTDPRSGRAFLSFAVHSDASGGVADALDPATQLRALACRANNGSSPFQCGRTYLASSADAGRTWSTFHPMDSADYPAAVTNGWNGGPSAAFGAVAAAYVANGARCSGPCIVFETSRDDGATWTRHVVAPVRFPAATNGLSTSFNFEPYVAADPTRPGRYAVMVFDAGQRHLIIYVTKDSGTTWHRTALAEPGQGVGRWTPWIAYGSGGALGAMWRTSYADGSFDVWAAVAAAGDARFGAPVRLSSARSPGPVAPGGDDASDVVMTRTTLYAAWGDQRGGPPPAAWFGSASNHVGSYRFASAG